MKSFDGQVAEAAAAGGAAELTAFYDACAGDARRVRLFLRDHKKLVFRLFDAAVRNLEITRTHPGAAVLAELADKHGHGKGAVEAAIARIQDEEDRRPLIGPHNMFPDQDAVERNVSDYLGSLEAADRVAYHARRE